jgi:carbonic anhydrase
MLQREKLREAFMKKRIWTTLAVFLLLGVPFAQAEKAPNLHETIKGAIADIMEDNEALAQLRPPGYFKEFQDIQKPRVTMLLCSDSRVQVDNFSQGAENDIFVARNIGNQYVTTQGSVEYGVNVLKTPVLMIIGHSHCGAVKAALGDYSQVALPIQKELNTLDLKGAADDKQGVILNVHHQVETALADYKTNVEEGKLAIIGAVYDFRNDYGYGDGHLIIVNLNGEQDPQKVQASGYFQGQKNVAIGVKKSKN